MDMWNAPSDRDYSDYLNPQEPEGEDPDNPLQPEPEALGFPEADCTF